MHFSWYLDYIMVSDKKKLSILIACYNEEHNIEQIYERLTKALHSQPYALEIIYIDNNSSDDSEKVFRALADRDSRVKVLFMSRNFGGPQSSYFAGLQHAAGDGIVLLDGDLQDPPEIIPELIQKWEEGYDVVYGVRTRRKGSIMRRIAYKLFYRLFKKLAYITVPLDAGEFSLMDRKVVDQLASLPEREILIRGLRAYVGFKQVGVEYVRDDRHAGKSTTNFFQDLQWAKRFIISFSTKPLEWISYIAFFAFLVSFAGLVLNLILYIITPESPSGIPTLIFALLFLGGVQLLALSIIGEYLSRVLFEVKGRPRYIVREILNNEEKHL